MAVTTVSRTRHGTRVRGRLYTERRGVRRQKAGRATAILMAMGAGFIGLVLAPSYIVPIGLMAFFVLVGGAIMDETAMARWLAVRLLGPVLALAGIVLVIWLIATGAL
jgi:hypothetical protein